MLRIVVVVGCLAIVADPAGGVAMRPRGVAVVGASTLTGLIGPFVALGNPVMQFGGVHLVVTVLRVIGPCEGVLVWCGVWVFR